MYKVYIKYICFSDQKKRKKYKKSYKKSVGVEPRARPELSEHSSLVCVFCIAELSIVPDNFQASVQTKFSWKTFSDHVIRRYVYAQDLSDQSRSRRGYFDLGSYNYTKIKWPVLGQGTSRTFWHLLTRFLRFVTFFEFWHHFWFFFNQNLFHQYPYLTLK